MLILAGVAINLTVGDNGIFKKTADSADITKREHAREKLSLVLNDVQMRRIKEGESLALSEELASEIKGYKEITSASFDGSKINTIVDGYDFTVNGDLGIENKKEIVKVEPENLSDWEYRVEENGTATILAYKGNAIKVVVPNYIEGYWVKQVGGNVETYGDNGTIWGEEITEYVEHYNSWGVNVQNTITEIVVSDGIEVIGKYAFAFANELEKITFPRSVHTIGAGAIQLSRYRILQENKLHEINLYKNIRTLGGGQGEYNKVGIIGGRENIIINVEYERYEIPITWEQNWKSNIYWSGENPNLNTTINYGVKMD